MSKFTVELVTSTGDTYQQTRYVDLDLVNHVHKRLETFAYLDDIKSSSVPLDYFESRPLNAKYNLFIADRSHQVSANSLRKVDSRQGFEKIKSVSYSSSYSDVLITNKTFVDEFNRQRPLFFKHVLPENTIDVQLEIVESGNVTIVDTGYVVDLSARAIYTNYQNYFDQDTGAYRLHFLTSTTSAGVQTRTLLNPVPAVTEATWEDIDLDTGELYTNISVYTKEKNTSGYTYYFSRSDTWWIKPQLKSLIRCRPPAGRSSDESWYLRVSNGDITTLANGATRRYWLPEYLTQPYQPSFPYIFNSYGKLLYVSERVAASTRGLLAIDPDNGRHVTVYISDFEGNLLKVWTTNTSLSGTRYSNTNVFYQTDKILCWDNQSGTIVFSESVLPSWQYSAEFFYEADDLEYTSLNLNPIQNRDLLQRTVVFYVVPNADVDDRGLHYLLVEADGRISYCSQSQGFSYPNLQLTNADGTYNSNTVVGLKYISDLEEDTFITQYTVGYENSKAYMVLAEVNVIDHARVDKAIVYDVSRSGETLVSLDSATFAKNPRALQSVYGYGEDGSVVPMNNVVVIQAPLDLLTDYGGVLERDQAEKLLKRYVAAGTYPLIDWTYPWADVDVEAEVAGQVTLGWTWEGTAWTYKLYRRFNSSNEWQLIHTATTVGLESMSYVDTDVESDDAVYYELRLAGDYEFPAPYSIAVKVK